MDMAVGELRQLDAGMGGRGLVASTLALGETPQIINFMATYGRGLICLALTRERVDKGAKVLIPAPVLAEIIRGDQVTEPPRVRGIEVAPFSSGNVKLLPRP